MLRTILCTSLLTVALLPQAAQASDPSLTTQAGLLGTTQIAGYPVRVRGKNGVIYACKVQEIAENNQRIRRCRRLETPFFDRYRGGLSLVRPTHAGN